MAGQVWAQSANGGYMYSDNLSNELRHTLQPAVRFRAQCDLGNAVGKHRGEYYHWNIYGDLADSGGAILETESMPTTGFEISQGTLTITEYGLAVPFTFKLEHMAEHPVKAVIHKKLKHNAVKTFDSAAHTQFDATPLRVAPTGGTSTTSITLSTTGSTAITNNVGMALEHIKLTSDQMQERNIPPKTDDGYYVCLARPSTFRPMKDDLENIKMYTESGVGELMSGEIGRYESIRFVVQTNIASEAWTNGASDAAYFIGDDAVMEGVSLPEEIRAKIGSEDYGRAQGIAWYYIGGYGLTRTVAADATIIKWDSAA